MTKIFKLLKDLPDYKAGIVYRWEEGIGQYVHSMKGVGFNKEHVENNPEWFEEIPEPTPVTDQPPQTEVKDLRRRNAYFGWNKNAYYIYSFQTNQPIDSKLEALRGVIEGEVNGGDLDIYKAVSYLETNGWVCMKHKEYYVQKEKIQQEAFDAGRERIGGAWNEQIKNWKYRSFSDYKHPNPSSGLYSQTGSPASSSMPSFQKYSPASTSQIEPDFCWTDELVVEFSDRLYRSIERCKKPSQEAIDNFKKSKSPSTNTSDELSSKINYATPGKDAYDGEKQTIVNDEFGQTGKLYFKSPNSPRLINFSCNKEENGVWKYKTWFDKQLSAGTFQKVKEAIQNSLNSRQPITGNLPNEKTNVHEQRQSIHDHPKDIFQQNKMIVPKYPGDK